MATHWSIAAKSTSFQPSSANSSSLFKLLGIEHGLAVFDFVGLILLVCTFASGKGVDSFVAAADDCFAVEAECNLLLQFGTSRGTFPLVSGAVTGNSFKAPCPDVKLFIFIFAGCKS